LPFISENNWCSKSIESKKDQIAFMNL
jgi:hypothetical protein